MENEILNKIQIFIEEKRWKYDFQFSHSTRLAEDLKITGDDSVEFLIEFGKEFNVDVSNFKAADYFDGEGGEFIESIIKIFSRKKEAPKQILTLGHLEKAVYFGRLDEEVIHDLVLPD